MTDTVSSVAPPGWYDDPSDPAAYRWWSGEAWTEHTGPKQPEPPAADPYAIPQSYLAYTRDPAARGNSYIPVAQQITDHPKGSPNTPGIWLMSFTPLMGLVLAFPLATIAASATVRGVNVPAQVISFGLAVLFAQLDGRELEFRGWRRTSSWWLLLVPPIAWLIVRGRSMRKQGATVWPLELVYLGGVAINLLLAFFAAAAYVATHR